MLRRCLEECAYSYIFRLKISFEAEPPMLDFQWNRRSHTSISISTLQNCGIIQRITSELQSYRRVKEETTVRTVLFPVEKMTFLCFEVRFVTIGSQCFICCEKSFVQL